MTTTAEITQLLERRNHGDEDAQEELFAHVYEELHRIAKRQRRRAGHGATLQTTEIVSEAYIRLFDQKALRSNDRAHFFNTVARCMRQLLVDQARRSTAAKRDRRVEVTLEDAVATERAAEDVLALEEAMSALERSNERWAAVVHHKYFLAHTDAETAQHLSMSTATVKRDWAMARVFLHQLMVEG